MSGETKTNVSPWTIDSLKEHMEALRADDKEAVEAALTAAKEAVDKANSASEKRFDSVNEFRNQQKDIISTFLPRAEFAAVSKASDEKISSLDKRIGAIENQAKGAQLTAGKIYAAIACVGVVLTIIVLLANNVF